MTDKNRDASSDSERSDPKVADANREELKKDADEEIQKIRKELREENPDKKQG
jgi:hypothetical protein